MITEAGADAATQDHPRERSGFDMSEEFYLLAHAMLYLARAKKGQQRGTYSSALRRRGS